MTTLRIVATAVACAIFPSALGCSRDDIEAVNLSNEADKSRDTNPEEAISKYEQATRLDPKNHRIFYKLARAYKKKEDWSKAAQAAGQAARLAPTYATYSFEQGYAMKQMAVKGPTTWAEAKVPLEEAVKKDPNLADAYEDLADVELQLDDEQGALRDYTKAIEVNPDDLAFYGPLAELYVELGYRDQAEQVLKAALTRSSAGAAATEKAKKYPFVIHTLLGDISEQKGSTAQAVFEYEAAKKICGACNEGGQQIAYLNLGVAYASLNPPRKDEALRELQVFNKICKGGAKERYADQCAEAEQYAAKLGGTL